MHSRITLEFFEKYKCPDIAFVSKDPDVFLMSSYVQQKLDCMIIFYFHLVCSTFSISYSVLPFHFIYVFQFLDLLSLFLMPFLMPLSSIVEKLLHSCIHTHTHTHTHTPMGVSRQECQSGMPLPSPICIYIYIYIHIYTHIYSIYNIIYVFYKILISAQLKYLTF